PGWGADLQLDLRISSPAAGLFLNDFFPGRGLRNGLAISDLRLTDICLDAELALHAIDDDLEMQLAHARDDRLAGFVVGRNIERRIFLRQTSQRYAEFVLVCARLRFNSHANDGR